MSVTIKAEGGRWRAEAAQEGGTHLVVFFCESSDQRPYRVVRVEDDQYQSNEALAAASDDDLAALFEASESLGRRVDYPSY